MSTTVTEGKGGGHRPHRTYGCSTSMRRLNFHSTISSTLRSNRELAGSPSKTGLEKSFMDQTHWSFGVAGGIYGKRQVSNLDFQPPCCLYRLGIPLTKLDSRASGFHLYPTRSFDKPYAAQRHLSSELGYRSEHPRRRTL
jgi:hypothetical protein